MFGEILGGVGRVVGAAVNVVGEVAGLASTTLEEFGEVLDTLTGQQRERAVVVLYAYERNEISKKQAAEKLLMIMKE